MTAELPAPVVLQGRHIRLEPLTVGHVPDLFAAGGGDDAVWRWLPTATPRTEDELRSTAKKLIEGEAYTAFAVVLRATGRAVGWTTYAAPDAANEHVEIGWTWYGRAHWGGVVNAEAKLLLLTHAFETLGMGRVHWKTDHLNVRSQRAVAALGAVREGVQRRARRRPDGSWRDSVHFSMLSGEWPEARKRLAARVGCSGQEPQADPEERTGTASPALPGAGVVRVSPATPGDHTAWRQLFEGYAAFYRIDIDGARVDRVWNWLLDPAHGTHCLLARDADGRPVGLAHYRTWAWTLRAGTGCFLDDLFVAPGHRGTGTADALIAEVRRIAERHGWDAVRWLTAEDNHRARAVYARHAKETGLIAYQAECGA